MRSIDGGRKSALRSAPLGEVRSICYRRRWQIVVTFSLALLVVAITTFTAPAEYDTHMKILVKSHRVTSGVDPQNSQPGEVSEADINTEIELLNSDDLLRRVVTICGLDRTPPNGKMPAERRKIATDRAVAQLQHSLKISPAHKADIIEVSYTSDDPDKAVNVLRQLASAYLEYHLLVRGSPGTHEFFSNQAKHYQGEVKNAETKLSNFRLKKDIVLFQEQKAEILRRAEDSNSALLATEAAVREYASKIAQMRAKAAAAPPRVTTQSRTITNQNSVERLGTMIVELRNRRTLLLSKFRPDDRTVQEVSQEIVDTQAALEKAQAQTSSEQATDINTVHQALELDAAKGEAEYAGLEARRQELIRQAAAYRAQLQKLASSTAEYDDLSRTEKEAEENYILYARKAEEARIADSLDQQKIANVAIAENPIEPSVPSRPNKPRNMALGTLFAGFLSLGIAFSSEYLAQPFPEVETDSKPELHPPSDSAYVRDVIRKQPELEALTGLPVFALRSAHISRLETRSREESQG
jgi:uncharacterized protein involved in exopolysaccharide biosynthesis